MHDEIQPRGARDVDEFDSGPGDPLSIELAEFEAVLGHTFVDRELLHTALAHRSYVAEHLDTESNERLEFLGDAVLGLVVADELFRRWIDKAEGPLAKARAAVINAEYLAAAATDFDLGRYVLLGKGEAASGGREKPSILADTFEAVIGAVYLDGGMTAARDLVLTVVGPDLDEAITSEGSKDYKTRLQEYAARRWSLAPEYVTKAYGPEHAKQFTATVEVGSKVTGAGHGRSKKQAEQAAARAAWHVLKADSTEPVPNGLSSELPNREGLHA